MDPTQPFFQVAVGLIPTLLLGGYPKAPRELTLPTVLAVVGFFFLRPASVCSASSVMGRGTR